MLEARHTAQMASVLDGALGLAGPAEDAFTDGDASIHETAINRRAGITQGCGPNLFCPTYSVGRDQMAAFLFRTSGA